MATQTPTPTSTTRRLITAHDPKTGLSIFTSDEKLTPYNPIAPSLPVPPTVPGFTIIHKTRGFPDESVNDETPTERHATYLDLVDGEGVTCRVVDFPPVPSGATEDVNIMHRTQSVDFGVVLKGRIWAVLDSGEEKEVFEGEIVVQRGTNHAWQNRSTELAKMLFVLVPSVPVQNKASGQVFENTDTRHLSSEEGAKAFMAKMAAQKEQAK